MTKGLSHIQDNEVHKSSFQQFCNHISIGPLEIKYCVDLTVPQITFSVYLAGIKIGGGTLNTSDPSVTVGGSALGFKAEITLTADFSKKEVDYDIQLCTPVLGCDDFSGKLFSW